MYRSKNAKIISVKKYVNCVRSKKMQKIVAEPKMCELCLVANLATTHLDLGIWPPIKGCLILVFKSINSGENTGVVHSHLKFVE